MPEERQRLKLDELMNWAGFFTIARAPIAALFPFVADRPRLALGLYLVGVGTDVVDGLIARRTGTMSYTGAMVDGYMDKLLHAVVALSLVWHGVMPAWWLLLWFSREWVQLVMLFFLLPAYLRGEFKPRGANRLGKNTTLALALSMVATMLGASTAALGLSALTGVFGVLASLSYLRQMLEDRRARARKTEMG